MKTCTASLLLLLAVLLSTLTQPLYAATQNGVVTGLILDQSGAPIAGAVVTLVNASIGVSRKQTTDATGTYTFLEVKPTIGYVLMASMTGFEPEISSDFDVSVNDLYVSHPPILLTAVRAAVQEAHAATPPQPGAKPEQATKPSAPPTSPVAQVTTQPPKSTQPAAPRARKPQRQPSMLPDESTTLSGVVDSDAVHTLPLADRDFIGLALLAPGTSPVEQGSELAGASLVVNGVRANMNNFLLDGADNNDYTINQSLPFQIVEAMQEFRVQASTSTAEFGRNAGAQINVVSRSGSNRLHGTLFGFNRNSALSENNALSTYGGGTFDGFVQAARVSQIDFGNTYFTTPVLSDPTLNNLYQKGTYVPLNQNQFGANLGGPIKKNKAFFFFNYEGFRADDPRPLMERVPDMESRSAVNCFFGATCNPQLQALLNLYPTPNVPTSTVLNANGNPVSNPVSADNSVTPGGDIDFLSGAFYTGRSRNFTNSDNYLGRVDVQLTTASSLSFKYNMQNVDQVQGGQVEQSASYPGSGIDLNGRNQNFSVNYVQNMGSHTVNQARVGWNRFRLGTLPLDHSLDASNYFQNLNSNNIGLPTILLGGFENTVAPYPSLGAPLSAPNSRVDSVYSAGDNFSHKWGRNVFEAGGEFRRNHLDVDNEAAARGLVAINSVQDSLALGNADFASIARVNSSFGNGTFARAFDANAYDWFVQDTWRPRSNVSVNFGLRHEINQAPAEAHNLLVNDYPGTCQDGNGLSLVCLIRSGTKQIFDSAGNPLGTANFTAPAAGFKTDFKNISPHFGIAASPGATGKTVFRGGFALVFDQQPMEPSVDMLLNPPYVQQTASFLPFGSAFPPGFLTQSETLSNGDLWFPQPYSITARDPNTRSSYVLQYHLGVQQQLAQKAVLGVEYVGSGGRRLPRNRLLLECTANNFTNPNSYLLCLPPMGTSGPSPFLSESVISQENRATSSFDSLQARLDTRAFHGFTVHLHYQWSHSIDDASSPTAPVFLLSPTAATLAAAFFETYLAAQGFNYRINRDQLAALNNVNPTLSLRAGLPETSTLDSLPNDTTNSNLAAERGNSDFDIRHRFVASYIYDLPSWSRGGRLLNGWQLAGVTVVQTGQPFSVFGNFYGALLRPNLSATPQINNTNPNAAIDNAVPAGCNVTVSCPGTTATSSFDTFPTFNFMAGSLPRNTFYGPNLINFDFSVLKNTYIREGKSVQFRAEFFNLFSRTNFGQPFSQTGQFENNPFSGISTNVPNPFFGQILNARSARQIQFGLKFVF